MHDADALPARRGDPSEYPDASGPGFLHLKFFPAGFGDILGPHSSIFDAPLTRVTPADGGGVYARVVSWYDNEWGYSNGSRI